MIQEKTCPTCGSNLKYDTIHHLFTCPFCGKVEQQTKTATLEEIDEAIGNSAFPKAKELITILEKETPDDPRLSLRKIYCKYQCKSVGDFLPKNRKIVEKMNAVLNDDEWRDLSAKLDEEKKAFVSHVRKYCTLSMKVRETYEAINLSTSPYRKESGGYYEKAETPGYIKATHYCAASGVMVLIMCLIYGTNSETRGSVVPYVIFGIILLLAAFGIWVGGQALVPYKESAGTYIKRKRISESDIEKKKAECEEMESEADSLLEKIREEEKEIG